MSGGERNDGPRAAARRRRSGGGLAHTDGGRLRLHHSAGANPADLEAADRASAKALALASNLAEAHRARGYYFERAGDYEYLCLPHLDQAPMRGARVWVVDRGS